jgi:hypothetical protein
MTEAVIKLDGLTKVFLTDEVETPCPEFTWKSGAAITSR